MEAGHRQPEHDFESKDAVGAEAALLSDEVRDGKVPGEQLGPRRMPPHPDRAEVAVVGRRSR